MKLSIEQTDKILIKLKDSGFEVIDTNSNIMSANSISEEYFNENVNEALEAEGK